MAIAAYSATYSTVLDANLSKIKYQLRSKSNLFSSVHL